MAASGRPRVLDFGVARVTESFTALSTMETMQGQIVGTLTYMAPEQLAGDPEAVSARSDVYALGVIAFELLVGRRPIDAGELPVSAAVPLLLSSEATRLGAIDARLTGDVETIVGKALEKDPERRYASAAALAETSAATSLIARSSRGRRARSTARRSSPAGTGGW